MCASMRVSVSVRPSRGQCYLLHGTIKVSQRLCCSLHIALRSGSGEEGGLWSGASIRRRPPRATDTLLLLRKGSRGLSWEPVWTERNLCLNQNVRFCVLTATRQNNTTSGSTYGLHIRNNHSVPSMI